MKLIKTYFFIALMIIIFFGLSWFSLDRNRLREKENILIEFTSPPRFLEADLVNKMLTQNWSTKSVLEKESLDLKMLEDQLNNVAEIENSEVFILPQGDLSISITERTPTFMIEANTSLYGDAKGAVFPYLSIDDLKLPVFKTDTVSSSLIETANLIEKLNDDPFLKAELVMLFLEGTTYKMHLKSYPFEVILGNTSTLNKKIEKLKIFCAFQNIQDSLKGYKKINLTYSNQVVATTF